MGFLLLFVTIGYLGMVVPLVLWIVRHLTRSKTVKWLIAVLLLVGPFGRQLFCGLIVKIVAKEPLQEIYQSVESPLISGFLIVASTCLPVALLTISGLHAPCS